MSIAKIFRPRAIALGVVALVFASATYGYAAANTVPTGNAGDGQNNISGYTVSNVKYTLNASDPGNIDAAAFDLAGAAKPETVKAKLVGGVGSYYNCTTTSTASPYRYTCPTTSPQATTAGANELRVIAAD